MGVPDPTPSPPVRFKRAKGVYLGVGFHGEAHRGRILAGHRAHPGDHDWPIGRCGVALITKQATRFIGEMGEGMGNDLLTDCQRGKNRGAWGAKWTDCPSVSAMGKQTDLAGLHLRDWQIDAFAAWAAKGCKGVVEAVTGAGKTRLALACAKACLARGGRVLVLVPTLELQRQWVRQVRQFLPGVRVGRLGGGEADDFGEVEVLIATPHSAAGLPLDPGGLGLLIADEAHRYGAPTWASALHERFGMRLALTATYERNDDGISEVLGPYFGPVIYSYTFADAARDQVIAPFSVGLIRVELNPVEQASYTAYSKKVQEARQELIAHGFPRFPKDLIAKAAKVAAQAEGVPNTRASREVVAARMFLAALGQRRAIAARCSAKLDVISQLIDEMGSTPPRTLVFTDTVEQAEDVVSLMLNAGQKCWAIHGELKEKDRRTRLAAFANGTVPMVVAPRVLDEGIDVPDAALAVVLASFRTRRQMIQRLGRVLRLKSDNAHARLLIAGAKDTREDPNNGAQREFLSLVTGVATQVHTLALGDQFLIN